MEDMNTGFIAALSMTINALIQNLPPDLARQIHRDLQAAAQVQQEEEAGDPPEHAQHRDLMLQSYLSLLESRARRG